MSHTQIALSARQSAQRGDLKEAIDLWGKAIQLAPEINGYRLRRAQVYDRLRNHEKCIEDCSAILQLVPQDPDALQMRGSARFKAGDIVGSIADFDAAIEQQPRREIRHWQRGISYYYAGEYAKGSRQFELYQTYDGGDVENVVWRYLCQARHAGKDKALRDILPLEHRDTRIPMMEVYRLFRGEITPDEVLEAAERGNPSVEEIHHRLFYAHLYLGLFHESEGNERRALHHLREADHREIPHYMWDVAHVHLQRIHEDWPSETDDP